MIKNAAKNVVVMKNYALIGDSLSKLIGLMLSRKQNKALIFKFKKEKTIALHMFFVFYPIDVLFLDKNKIIVDKKEDFKPFALYKSKEKAMYAIEMPNGIIKKTNTEIGDKIEF